MHVAAIDDGEVEIGDEEKTGEEEAKVIGELYAIVSAKRDLAHVLTDIKCPHMHIGFYSQRIGVSRDLEYLSWSFKSLNF